MISARTRIIKNSLHVRKWHSVPERASWGTEYARGAKNRLLWYATHFQGHSVRRTAFSGTGVIFGTGNPLLWYAAHFQGPRARGSPLCTEYARGAQNRLLWYATRFRKHSVLKKGSCGTRCIFRGSLCADNYLLLIQEPEHPERDLIVEDVFSIVLDHIAIFDVFNLFLPFLSPANLKGLSVNLKI